MSKRKPDPRGVMAIALFEIAVALERWAAAQERIAETNAHIAGSHAGHLDLAREDLDFRKHGAETFLAQSQAELTSIAADARAALPIKVGSASLLDQYRHIAKRIFSLDSARSRCWSCDRARGFIHEPDCLAQSLEEVLTADNWGQKS